MTTKNPEHLDAIQQLAGLKIADIRTRKKSLTPSKESVVTDIKMISAVASLADEDPDITEVLYSFLARLNTKKTDFNMIQEAVNYGDPDIIKAAVLVEDSQGNNGLERAKLSDINLYNSILDTKIDFKNSSQEAPQKAESISVKKRVEEYEKMISSSGKGQSR